MKYLKLFENFIDEPSFYRFNKTDILGQEDSMTIFPRERLMVGPENVNDVLVKNGFPDKKKCIHFMDEKAFDPSYKGLYGSFIYRIQIDDESKLGWSFFIPINDWFYKGNPFESLKRNLANLPNKIKDLLNSEYGDLRYPYSDDRKLDLEKMFNYLLQYQVIGTGTIENLKQNQLFGNHPVFVWTNDSVVLNKFIMPNKEPKEARPYKNKPLLTEDDFKNFKSKMGQFYSSESGKLLRRLQMRANENPQMFDTLRQESLRVLGLWIETQN
jgi:hypothetical protein